MRQIGFVGYGSMGSMLIRGLITNGQIRQEQIIVTRKNKERLGEIKEVWPEIKITDMVSKAAENSKYLFICVKPNEVKEILKELKQVLPSDLHIISIAGSLMLEDMEQLLDCKISKLMPTVISEVNEGISLICHNKKVSEKDAEELEEMLWGFTKILRTNEESFGFASDLTSCGPGFYAAMMNEFAKAGMRHNNSFKEDDIRNMILYTIYGTTKLMLEKGMNFTDVITRVATKGGITQEGVNVMEQSLPEVFDEVFEKSDGKREVISEIVKKQFTQAE
jgi:pyrroline-5-carboxylate reductase